MVEHRRFIRIIYHADAQLGQGQAQWRTEIRDLSIHGVLLVRPKEWQPTNKIEYNVSFSLRDAEIDIQMETELVQCCEQYLRMQIRHIDLDSISHLKRLVELNVGNDGFLERELAQLADIHSK
uniref:PilZ domain-containing protein n=1 Tax=Thaumasiovibrio occultus TaxID=1891184 RepID=UPI000B362054|nr:PilZ domain-containing protein [Thaumasiovibrio occultus]